jgi:acyl-CoA dehydrogenase
MADRRRAAAAVAAEHAAGVDREGAFPAAALDAIKSGRLLGAMLPADLGGDDASLADIASTCFSLGRACSSTALIFAMHQISLACILRHHAGSPWQRAFLQRVGREQLLLASSTTEGSGGGAVRSSDAAIEPSDGGFRLTRAATVISYGEQADAVVTTARRAADAAPSDQVLVVLPRETCRLQRSGAWDTLGMRGTCSLGFALEASGPMDQVLAAPYDEIHPRTMVPMAHILWGSVWAGIAAEALERARLSLRKKARTGTVGPGGAHLAQARVSFGQLRTLISAELARYQRIQDQPSALDALEYQSAIALLKVQASELALATVMSALRVCGLSGYRNDHESSVARLLRDVLSAPLMLSNDRLLADLQTSALLEPAPTTL